jgi:leucyl aminopeptidase
MRVSATTDAPGASDADTVVVGVFEGEDVAHDVGEGALQALLDSGEAKPSYKSLAHTHADGKRWIVAGLGKRAEFDLERARVTAALAVKRAGELSTRRLVWELPHDVDDATAAALVEGTELTAFRFDRYQSKKSDQNDRPAELESLTISAHHDVSATVGEAVTVSEAVNAARVLQNTPGNDMTPTALAQHARELADEIDGLEVVIEGRDGIVALGMGAFAAVAQGSYQEPALILMRYEGPAASAPTLGFVGKAVTFDTGGISIKPSAKMSEMKFDMSGGAAVIEATAAIARLGLPVRLVSVIGATENMPSGRSVKPGDIVLAMNGTTIEVNNTDAEGRLVLSDCLAYALEQGAERLVDLATLTGAILVALGSTYAGLMSNDDEWAANVEAAGDATGELVWRMPLHPEFADMIKGQYGDIDNAPEGRKGGSVTAAEFLKRFVGETPWAHLDIAGTSWDLGRPYAAKGGSGFGVRLLVELARRHAGS